MIYQCSAEKHEHGHITRNVAVFIQHSDGKFIISKRASPSRSSQNLYDVSVCGHVDAGEDYMTAALRETEKSYITAPLEELAVVYREFPYKWILMKHFTDILYGRSDSPICWVTSRRILQILLWGIIHTLANIQNSFTIRLWRSLLW